MAVWQWLVDSAGVLLLIVLAYGVLLVLRRRVLAREGGTFELSVRTHDRPGGRGWSLGIGRYHRSELQWFRIFTPWPLPTRSWQRRDLAYVGQRELSGPESAALFVGHVIVVVKTTSGTVELAMSPAALTGLQSWLEAGPPGDRGGAGG